MDNIKRIIFLVTFIGAGMIHADGCPHWVNLDALFCPPPYADLPNVKVGLSDKGEIVYKGSRFTPFVKGCRIDNIVYASGTEQGGDALLTFRYDLGTNSAEATTVTSRRNALRKVEMTSHLLGQFDSCKIAYHEVSTGESSARTLRKSNR